MHVGFHAGSDPHEADTFNGTYHRGPGGHQLRGIRQSEDASDVSGSQLNESVSVGSFDFTNGWGAWKRVANKQSLTEPQVAINASGQALVAYVGIPAKRVNGKAPTSISGPYDERAYALRF